MKNLYAQMTAQQLQEHRLEIENRIRNLFWTVSGDYTLNVKPDVQTFAKSPSTALYDAIKQGAFANHFSQDELALYMMKKMHLSAQQRPLFELVQLCIDAAVYPLIREERKGIDEIRTRTFTDIVTLVSKNAPLSLFGKARMYIINRFLGNEDYEISEEIKGIVIKIDALEHADTTQEIIQTIDTIYNRYFDTSFETEHGNLQRVLQVPISELSQAAYQEFLTDEQMDKIMEKFLRQQGMNVFSLKVDNAVNKKRRPVVTTDKDDQDITEDTEPDEQAVQKALDYVELNYGKTYLTTLEQEHVNRAVCRGVHRGCKLHYTDGILQAPVQTNYRYRMNQMQNEKNKMYYYVNHRVVKRNIIILAEALQKALALRNEASISRARTGELVPARLWKLNRTDDDKIFNKIEKVSDSDFVVDILLDSSGSQLKRQPQVATQGYIIGEALTQAGIPHRVMSYCTTLNYTVLHRFHEYDDDIKQDMRIFEFNASASNRDGLAIKAAYDSLAARDEEHKILIVLSDGRPSDVVRGYTGMGSVQDYNGEGAIRDTAFEVRRARALGISVLGIFSGSDEDLMAEKKIFGKDFAYIRNISNFSHVVGTYLRKQIDSED